MITLDQPIEGTVLLRVNFKFGTRVVVPAVFDDVDDIYETIAEHIDKFVQRRLRPVVLTSGFDDIYREPITLEFSSGGFETEEGR